MSGYFLFISLLIAICPICGSTWLFSGWSDHMSGKTLQQLLDIS
jgi:hypothetical protein